jgi:hypothetical protein
VEFTASTGSGGGSYEKPKPGTYTGILIGVADLGTHVGQFGAKQRLMLRWELHRRKGPVLDTAGHILTITAMYNQSFDAKSSLRPVVEAHVGKIADGIKIRSQDWLGRPARLVLKESDDGKGYINVDTVTPLDPEEDEVPKQVETSEHWELKDGGKGPDWSSWMYVRSEEWKRANPGTGAGTNGQGRVPVAAGAAAAGDDDDAPPF